MTRSARLGLLAAPAVAIALDVVPLPAGALDLVVNETEDAVDAARRSTSATTRNARCSTSAGLGRFDDPAVAGSVCDSGAFERQAP